ncbi:LysR family transcriptional regulator [Agrococcus sp. SGAir0287]|uniref:LysR family transcriptional regulator n=1 Tax=Agrococcus sp. SGAir0287 TaxID=2070347 RepID=UPI0010CCF5F4|nr:LysR family transcriptional regulator [Agrococcus sp. SGAir0287]QCR19149.1 LysR family transcriptional regulator [Agrococcus sp. SGAir0287]
MDLDPRRVLIFRAVARAGSVSGGARSLGWTQPAVSQHLRTLEGELGTALLLRGPTGVTLTEAGERLLARADAIDASLRQAEAELAELVAGGGTVTLAAFPSAMADLVPRAIARLLRDAPQVQVRVVEAEPPEALAAVAGNDVDLAVVFEYAESHDDVGLERVPLGDDPSMVVVPSDHALAAGDAIALADLAQERWVAGCPRCRQHLELLADRAGFAPDVQHSTDDLVAAQSFVARTGAVALLPSMAMAAHRREGVAALPLADGSGRVLSIRHRAGADRVPAIRAVVDAIAAVV